MGLVCVFLQPSKSSFFIYVSEGMNYTTIIMLHLINDIFMHLD